MMQLKKNTWRTIALRDVCDRVKSVEVRNKTGCLNYIDIGAIDSNLKRISAIQELDWSEASTRARQIIQKGDTLFSTVRVNLERIAFVQDEIPNGVASTGFTVIRANNKADSRFLFYSTSSPNFINRVSRLQKGTAYPAVTDKIVFNEKILLPPIEEQIQIASLFESFDTVIENLEKQEKTIKNIALRIITDLTSEQPMFGNLLNKSMLTRKTIGDIAFDYSKREDNPRESNYDRYVGSDSIGRFDFKVESWQSNKDIISSMKVFEPKDYLLVRRSLYASDFRERAPRADFTGLCSGDILTIKEKPEFIYDGYLLIILNSPRLWEHIVANASGSITRRVKWKELAKFELLVPRIEIQKVIIEVFNCIQSIQKQLKQQSTTLKNLKQNLLNEILG